MDIVINYDKDNNVFKIYESSTETLLLSTDFAEGLINLNTFLRESSLISPEADFLRTPEITYHFDSYVMGQIIQSNVNLLKRIKSGPSEFKLSQEKFGQGNSGSFSKGFSGGSRNFSGSKFSGSSGFKASSKKWIK